MTSIAAIERAAAIAWPALETATMGEWLLSAGEGFSRRRNSAVPLGRLPDGIDRRIDEVVAWYRERGITPRFRMTPLCDDRVDAILDRRGFVIEDPVAVMARPLDDPGTTDGVTVADHATEQWVDAQLEVLGIDRSLVHPWLSTLAALPDPAAFVNATVGDSTVGVGFGVVVDELLGSFELAVAEQYRRQGHATRLMSALHAFGCRRGARSGYLQVVEENRPAAALYERLGYGIVYRYWYRAADA